jgi:hypothetical protein
VSIPWSGVAEAWIVVRNEATAGPPARFALRGSHDPYAPFDLASLVAGHLAGSIALEWTTASEKGLVGERPPVGPPSGRSSGSTPWRSRLRRWLRRHGLHSSTTPPARPLLHTARFTDPAWRPQVVSGRSIRPAERLGAAAPLSEPVSRSPA